LPADAAPRFLCLPRGVLTVTARREVVQLAALGVGDVRDVFLADVSDVQRAAALVEIAGAAAVLARTIYKYRHVDPSTLDGLVSSRVDVRAVLGRGRWLPTMVWHVPEPPKRAQRAAARARGKRRRSATVQPSLLVGLAAAGGGR
jgi:hypothetical protein